MIEQLKAFNKFQRTTRTVKHMQSNHFKDTAEPLTTQPDLLSTIMLAELQHLHGLNTHEEFQDVDQEFEDLTITDTDQNADYDAQYYSDEAAKWLAQAGL